MEARAEDSILFVDFGQLERLEDTTSVFKISKDVEAYLLYMHNQYKKPMNLLLNFSGIEEITPACREVLVSMLQNIQSFIKNIASVVKEHHIQAEEDTVLSLAGLHEHYYFKDRDEALAWLHENREAAE